MTPAVFFAGVLTFLWPHAQGAGTLIPLAIFYGATSGAFAGIIGAPLIQMGDSSDVGRRVGMFLTILSIGALAGPPISGAIARATNGYTAVGTYAGELPPPSPSSPFLWEVLRPIRCWDLVLTLPVRGIFSFACVLRLLSDGCSRATHAISILCLAGMERHGVD